MIPPHSHLCCLLLPLSSLLSPRSLPPLLTRRVTLDHWEGKSPKSALLKAFPVPSLALFSALCHVTPARKKNWKRFQPLLILIKHISASVTADPIQTILPFKTGATIKVANFVFCCAVDPHTEWRFVKHLLFFFFFFFFFLSLAFSHFDPGRGLTSYCLRERNFL